MTYIEVIAGIFVLLLFLAGFSQAAYPALQTWQKASEDYQLAHDISFVADSFRKECSSADCDIGRWKKVITTVDELESCEIVEIQANGVVCALKAICIFNDEKIEIISEYTP